MSWLSDLFDDKNKMKMGNDQAFSDSIKRLNIEI